MGIIIIEDIFDRVIDDSLRCSAIHVNYRNIETELPELFADGYEEVFVAINSITERRMAIDAVKRIGGVLINVIDESAIIANTAIVGPGAYIGQGVLISSGVSVGEGSYIGMGGVIDYDTFIGNYCTLDTKVVVGNSSRIGDDCIIGMGSIIDHDERIPSASKITPLTVVSSLNQVEEKS